MLSLLVFMLSEMATESKMHNVHVCSCIAKWACVCTQAFLNHKKLVRWLAKVQTKNKPNYKLCAKASVYNLHYPLWANSDGPVWINIVLIKHKMWCLCLSRSPFSRHCHLRNHFSVLLAI